MANSGLAEVELLAGSKDGIGWAVFATLGMNSDFNSLLDDQFFDQFFQAWKALREGEELPNRRDVRLQDFASFASELLMYQLVSPTNLKCRLMGSLITERIKFHGPDINWFDFVAPETREAGLRWWQTLTSTPCAGIMQFSTGFLDGTNRIGRCILLPVQQTDGSIILMAISRASAVYRVDDPREELLISADCFQTRYIDIGFGLPEGLPEQDDCKPMASATLERLYPSD